LRWVPPRVQPMDFLALASMVTPPVRRGAGAETLVGTRARSGGRAKRQEKRERGRMRSDGRRGGAWAFDKQRAAVVLMDLRV
jgi:hypothetical protein